MKTEASLLPDTRHFPLREGLSREVIRTKKKVLLFRENQPKFVKWQGIDCLFVENTQSLFEKGKTDVQGAENRQLKQIDMAQMSNCDKIKVDMHFRVTIIRIVQQQ